MLQNRLIAEMELRGITDMDAGNSFLTEQFIDGYNRRFAREPETAYRAWREVPTGLEMDRAISFHYQAVVRDDNAVRLGGMMIDIPEGPEEEIYKEWAS